MPLCFHTILLGQRGWGLGCDYVAVLFADLRRHVDLLMVVGWGVGVSRAAPGCDFGTCFSSRNRDACPASWIPVRERVAGCARFSRSRERHNALVIQGSE